MNATRSLIALLSLAAPSLAQFAPRADAWDGIGGPSTPAYSLGFLRPSLEPWPEELRLAGAESPAFAPALRLEAEPEWLSLGFPGSAGVPPAERRALRRAELDGGPAIAFDDLPGGILLGLVAQPDFALVAPRLRAVGARLELVDGASVHPLPAAEPELLRACLAFAASARADQAAIDIRSSGRVDLAPEFVDTSVGLELIRADGIPHMRRPERRATKSLIVDRAARLVLDAATGEVRPEAELELRFYLHAAAGSPPGGGARSVEVGPVAGALRAELAECERIAAWVAFFRWALVADPEGVARLRAEQEPADLGLRALQTPRRVGPRDRGLAPPGGVRSGVADWMRAHRLCGRATR
jgi:hypothetical protein